MRKNGIQEVLVGSIMSLYNEAKTRVGVDSDLSEEFEVEVSMYQGSFLFAVVVDVITTLAKEGVLSELWYADDLFLMSETLAQL